MEDELYKSFEQKAKVADEYDLPEVSDFAWKKMQEKLDADQPRRGLWLVLPLLFLILGGALIGFYFMIEKSGSQKPSPSVKVSNDAITKTKENIADPGLPTKVPFTSKKTDLLPRGDEKKEVFSVHLSKAEKRSLLKTETKTRGSSGRAQAGISPNLFRENDIRFSFRASYSDKIPVVKNGRNFHEEISVRPPAFHLPKSIDRTGNYSKTEKERKLASKFFLFVDAGPLVSRVAKNTSGDMSFFYGGGIGYFLSKKLFVTAGISSAKVVYGANGASYKTPGTPYGSTLKFVDANCTILEIPVAVGYNFYEKKKIQLFATAGLSSQMMKRENYDYTSEYYGTITKGSWNFRNKNSHPFSAATISVGGSYSAGKHVSVKVAPFYKQSLSGVGEGEVRLNNYRLSLGAHYRF